MIFEPWGYLIGDTFYEEFYHATFISVCARTAGFNTVPTDMLSHATLILVMFLMWIGASPGSTGGGIKTTTFAVTIYALYAMIVGKERIEVFNREIHYNTVKQAFMVVIASIMFIFVGSVLLVWFEPNMDTTDLVFEVVSAVNTVGLSRGVTPDFGNSSKVLIVILMFVGRVGVLTFLLSLHIPRQEPRYKLPEENVIVG
jgi:Trk-type K+ transport system membrane component